MSEKQFMLDPNKGYFQCMGVDVMAFDDIYPEGHQSGVSVIMHGKRLLTNGDIRLEQTPGQWQPLPKQGARTLSEAENAIKTRLSYPDMSRHLTGFNPMLYPDCAFSYTVSVTGEGQSVRVRVDFDAPVDERFAGKICFNLEVLPSAVFGRPWIMDGAQGIFPRQPNGPTLSIPSNRDKVSVLRAQSGLSADINRLTGGNQAYSPFVADDIIALPYAEGQKFTLLPDDPLLKCAVESKTAPIKLYDGRMNHNNGWFVLSSEVPVGRTAGAIDWTITPCVSNDWRYPAVIQVSQVGYAPAQRKIAIIEKDARDTDASDVCVYKIDADGETLCASGKAARWGKFLRYEYDQFDFSFIREEGLYRVSARGSDSCVFRIAKDVYARGIWQPVLEYFLPVQMCHMRVNEKYRVWHGLCHDDDARMAPTNLNHLDGYAQGPSTLTKYKSGEHVPGLNAGGWHDAGDFDLRIESQAGEMYILSLAYNEFRVYYDATSIDQRRKVCEIHQPDGKNDILQQIEHGALSVAGGYKALGRLYRGIIASGARQYAHLGDASTMTDNLPASGDERWVFTEDNPPRELSTCAQLAASSQALWDFNGELACELLSIAKTLFEITRCADDAAKVSKLHAAFELYLATQEQAYLDFIYSEADFLLSHMESLGWIAARAFHAIPDSGCKERIRNAMKTVKADMDSRIAETPYGIPYRPHIWGAGWDIQRMGFQHYFLHRAFPELFDAEPVFSALNFVLGCHPGANTASFASGVGANSATVAYGMNRADFSYIPGGVISGTALIRPDFPELLEWPFLWQQTEYVLGGGSSHYMFLVLAAIELLK